MCVGIRRHGADVSLSWASPRRQDEVVVRGDGGGGGRTKLEMLVFRTGRSDPDPEEHGALHWTPTRRSETGLAACLALSIFARANLASDWRLQSGGTFEGWKSQNLFIQRRNHLFTSHYYLSQRGSPTASA